MGKLILVRHGESEGNARRHFTLTPEADITPLGRQQAHQAALKIKLRFRPKLVIASPYRRAHETGRIIAEELGLGIELEPGFREQSLGNLAGKPYEVVREDPTFDPTQSWLWRPEGGESHVDVLHRAGPLLDTYAKRFAADEVVIVSHGGVMRSLWAHVTGGNWEHAHVPPNCGIIVIEHEGGHYHHPDILHGGTWGTQSGG
jgi:broad specificity phosphatase PhoE